VVIDSVLLSPTDAVPIVSSERSLVGARVTATESAIASHPGGRCDDCHGLLTHRKLGRFRFDAKGPELDGRIPAYA
jgi:hypothetical protein